MLRSLAFLLSSFVLGWCLVGLAVPEAQAQSRRGQQGPAQRQMVPSGGAGHAPSQAGGANPAGTRLPSYAEPSSPPSFSQPPSSGAGAPGGSAQTNSGPGMPGDRNQVPLGGAEWLAAAGAAYALNRLRKRKEDPSEDEEDLSAV